MKINETAQLDSMKLCGLGRTGHCARARAARCQDRANHVEIACSDFALVPGCCITKFLAGEFSLLKTRIGSHSMMAIVSGQVEHAVIQGMETGQCYELECISHRTQFALEFGYGPVIQFFFPVERR